jgi:hypothetical protein
VNHHGKEIHSDHDDSKETAVSTLTDVDPITMVETTMATKTTTMLQVAW